MLRTVASERAGVHGVGGLVTADAGAPLGGVAVERASGHSRVAVAGVPNGAAVQGGAVSYEIAVRDPWAAANVDHGSAVVDARRVVDELAAGDRGAALLVAHTTPVPGRIALEEAVRDSRVAEPVVHGARGARKLALIDSVVQKRTVADSRMTAPVVGHAGARLDGPVGLYATLVHAGAARVVEHAPGIRAQLGPTGSVGVACRDRETVDDRGGGRAAPGRDMQAVLVVLKKGCQHVHSTNFTKSF